MVKTLVPAAPDADNPFSDLPLYQKPPLDTALAAEWERMPRLLGRWRDIRSLASNPDSVILTVEFRHAYVTWGVSPPDPAYDERFLASETIQIPVGLREPGYDAARDAVIAEAKEKALAAYAAWCTESCDA